MKKTALTLWVVLLLILIVFIGATNIYVGRRSSNLSKIIQTNQSSTTIPEMTPPSGNTKRYSEFDNPELKGVDDRYGSILGATVIDYIPTGEETADVLLGFTVNGVDYKFWMTKAICGSIDTITSLKVGSTYNITGNFFAEVTDLKPLKRILGALGGNIQSPGCQARIHLQPISRDEMARYFRGEDPSWGGKIRDLRGKFVLNNSEGV